MQPGLHAHDVLPFSIAGSPEVPDHHLRLVSECLLCLTGTPEPFSAPRRTIFCTGPMVELCVSSPPPAPVPPRRIAMRCSRCETGVILAQVRTPWKIGVSGLFLNENRRKFWRGWFYPSPSASKHSTASHADLLSSPARGERLSLVSSVLPWSFVPDDGV